MARKLSIVTAVAAVAFALSACEPLPPPVSFTVNTTVDGLDHDPGDGICEVTPGAGDCSMRAAFAEANASAGRAKVTAPGGGYNLTIADPTDGDPDLDVTGSIDLAAAAFPYVQIYGGSGSASVEVAETGTIVVDRVEFAGLRVDGSAVLGRSSIWGGSATEPALAVGPAGSLVLTNSKVVTSSAPAAIVNEGTFVSAFSSLFGSGHPALHTTDGARSVVGASRLGNAYLFRGVWFDGELLDANPACSGATPESQGYNRVPNDSCGLTDPTDIQIPQSTWVDQVPVGVLGCGDPITTDRGTLYLAYWPRPSDGDGDGVAACDIGDDETATVGTLSSGILVPATVGQCYSRTITGGGFSDSRSYTPYAWAATGLPPGLVLDGNVVHGIPTVAGTYPVTLTAQAAPGRSVGNYQLEVLPSEDPPATSCP
ncbi:MAG: hypothetical protein KF906_02495 [Actinobacteria bacterium]|nr:hypothetical protein [Actinomycetota bacterium]